MTRILMMGKNNKLHGKIDSPETIYRYYCVAFLDILNQRDMIRKIESLPDTEEEWQNFKKQVKSTIGTVYRFRKLFSDFFLAFSKQRFPPKDLDENHLEIYRKIEKASRHFLPKIQSFSDTVIIFVPLSDDQRTVYSDGIFSTLLSISGTYIGLMASGAIFRGGIDIGIGLEIEPNEIYGPVVLKAYDLESKIAKYPRVVIGDELANFLQLMIQNSNDSDHSKYNKVIATKCSELMFEDGDGRYALDYLGIAYRDFAGPTVAKFINKAKEFVEYQIEEAKRKRDTELFLRYQSLWGYFEDQLPHWDEIIPQA